MAEVGDNQVVPHNAEKDSNATEKDIKKMIKSYIEVDDKITTENKKMKELRKEKTELEESIKEYMLEHSIAKVDIGSGSLKISKKKLTKKLNKKDIMSILIGMLEEEKADEIINELFDDSELESITKLERSKKN